MKRILIILAFVASLFGASAQKSWTPINGYQRFVIGLGIPVRDTATQGAQDSAQMVIRPADGFLWYKYKTRWIQASASMVYPGAGIPISTGSAWGTSITDNSTNWNTAYTNRITSLTTTGSSGAATLVSNVLNIPTYTLSGLGGQPLATNLTSIGALANASGVLVNNGTGTFSYSTTPTLTGTNFTGVPYSGLTGTVPTWNQNTTGTAANITGTSNSTLTSISTLTTIGTLVAGAVPYSLLTGTIPTWNQNTTGTSANITGTTNSTLTTLSALSLPYSQVTGGPTSLPTTNAVTFNNAGTGAVSGTTFNGSAAQTISYNTVGASALAGSTSLTTTGTITSGTWNGTTIAVANGGSGATTLTGILKGNGTSAFTAATAGTDYMTPANVSASYVPYSGATGVVNLGANYLQTSSGIQVNPVTGTYPYTVYGDGTFTIFYSALYTMQLSYNAPTASRTIYLPDANGTLQIGYTNLTSIGALANAAGVLVNNGTGTFSYSTTPTLTGTNFSGTAASLNIGGNAATATNANNASTWNGQIYGGTYTTGTVSGFLIYNSTALDWRLATSVPTAISNTITTVGTLTAGSIPYSLLTGTPTISGSNTGDVTLATNSGLSFTSGQTLLTLGTPTSVTGSSTNSVTTTTHTHAVSGLTNTNLSGSAGITVGNGGTGVATITGILKGNGTAAFTAAVAGTDYQAVINGTGFVKASGTTISYDNSTYLTTTTAGTTYVPYTGATGAVNLGTNTLASGAITSANINIAAGGADYPNGQLEFTNTTNGGYVGIGSQLAGAGIIYFDHRATGNTGNFVFRNGTGGANTMVTIGNGGTISSGAITSSGTITSSATNGQIVINRAAATNSNPLVLQTAAANDWFIGSSPSGTSTSDLSFYSYGTSSEVLKIAKSTGAATFSSSVTATSGNFSGDIVTTSTTTSSSSGTGALRVSGGAGISGAINSGADITASGNVSAKHLISNGGLAPTAVAGTGAGTSPTLSITGTDAAGKISLTVGTGPSANAIIATISFQNSYGTAPYVIVTPGNATAAAYLSTQNPYVASTSTTTFVFNSGSVALGAGNTPIWYYHIIQ